MFGSSQTLGGLMCKTRTQNFKRSSIGCILRKLLCGYGREHNFDYGEYRYAHRHLQTASTTSSQHQCHGFLQCSFLWPPHILIMHHSSVFSAYMRMQLRMLKCMLNLQPYKFISFQLLTKYAKSAIWCANKIGRIKELLHIVKER